MDNREDIVNALEKDKVLLKLRGEEKREVKKQVKEYFQPQMYLAHEQE